ncbi:MAG: ABC transporter substrate-binding protein, partial [Haliea sp.]
RLVIAKRPDHPEAKRNPRAPDEIVYRVMRETEQRVAALLNNEIQIAQFIPPHLRQRVEQSPNLKITATDSVEIMFLAMQPKPPFDKKEVRQAVCHAINRDQIIATLLEGFASRLDGPVGPGQYGYDPNLKPKLTYDPERSKKLLAQAGFAKGVDVALQTPVGRYTLDKQLTEAMIPMLNAAGFRAKLLNPDAKTPIQDLYGLLVGDTARNDMIFDDVLAALEARRSPVIITERKDHLDSMAQRLSKFARNVITLKGGMSARERREVMETLHAVPDGEERIILATGRYLGEGFDDARLDTLFLTMPVSWRGTLTQYAGRLHRLHAAKREVIIYDYVDADEPMLAKMAAKREAGYKTLGYEVSHAGYLFSGDTYVTTGTRS